MKTNDNNPMTTSQYIMRSITSWGDSIEMKWAVVAWNQGYCQIRHSFSLSFILLSRDWYSLNEKVIYLLAHTHFSVIYLKVFRQRYNNYTYMYASSDIVHIGITVCTNTSTHTFTPVRVRASGCVSMQTRRQSTKTTKHTKYLNCIFISKLNIFYISLSLWYALDPCVSKGS